MATAAQPTGHEAAAVADLELDDAEIAPPPEPVVPEPFAVLVYSDDPRTRERVRLAIGRRPNRDLPTVEYVDVDSSDAVMTELDTHTIDLAILDGEATPVGGLGICRQAKNEVADCPPVLVLTGRRDDRWLAVWSLADAVVPHPIDAIELVDTVVGLFESIERRRSALR